MRSLAPVDSLVYLETNDLAAALQPLVDSKPFTEAAKYKPDLSPLKGVQVAVAITGFETSEEKLTDENSIGRIQPHFIAIADTHAWNFQAVKFAEQKLGGFVAKIYDSEPTLEKSDKSGGKYFTWTAADGRKAFALVIDSVIYFGNDESSIDKALAVRRGEADSIIKTGKLQPADAQTLARGYVSTEGVAQIANILALKLAADASDESEVQSAIASIVPQLLRNTITDITWTSTKGEQGYEDKWQINMPADVAHLLSLGLAPAGSPNTGMVRSFPSTAASVTIYDLKQPQMALRSLLAVVEKQTDPLGLGIIREIVSAIFAGYGIREPDKFLGSVDSTIGTAVVGSDADEHLTVAKPVNKEALFQSLTAVLKTKDWALGNGVVRGMRSDDESLAGFFTDDGILVFGEDEAMTHYFVSRENFDAKRFAPSETASPPSSRTIAMDKTGAVSVVGMLSDGKSQTAAGTCTSLTETRFTKSGIDRRTTSDLGFIGWIIAQLNEE